jgi:hypothetical protein
MLLAMMAKIHLTVLSVLMLAPALAGCGSLASSLGETLPARIDQRSSIGPTARQMFIFWSAEQNQREPSFEEMTRWHDQMDSKISRFLGEHPEVANAADVQTFRYDRQVTLGMTKEQVLILLGPPVSVTSDEGDMEKLARRFWPQIKGNATEVWVYPVGWRIYFAGQRVVDITQYVPRFS